MLIGKVAKKFNIGIETLRYYDKIGLLTVAKKNNQRFYSQKDIDKLQSIIAMKKLLFSLEDIKRILDIDERIDEGLNSNSICQEDLDNLLAELMKKQTEILDRERELEKVKKQLDKLISKVMDLKGDSCD